MSNPQNISEIYKEQEKSFLKHLRASKNLQEETIHKLRIDCKHLRSLVKFLEVSSKDTFHRKKILRLISPVYKSAGEIRTTSLNRKLIAVYRAKAISGFKKYLKSKENKEEKRFLKEVKRFDRKKFKKLSQTPLKFFEKENKTTVNKNSGKYIRDLFSEIRSYFTNVISNEDFHAIRKILKDVKTMTGLLEELNMNKKYLAQQKQVKDIEEKIGQWHDRVVLAEGLEKFIANEKTASAVSSEKDKKNKDDEKLSGLAFKLRTQNDQDKKIIAKQISGFLGLTV